MIKLDRRGLGMLLTAFSVILVILLIVVKADIDKQSGYLCQLISEDPNLNMDQCPAHQNNTSWILFLAFGISFLILGGGVYLVFMPAFLQASAEKKEFKDVDLSRLDGDEKKIYEMLKAGGGSMYQGDIIRQTGFTKVKTSRILDKLEGMKI